MKNTINYYIADSGSNGMVYCIPDTTYCFEFEEDLKAYAADHHAELTEVEAPENIDDIMENGALTY